MKVHDNGRSKGKEGQGRGGDNAKWGVGSQGVLSGIGRWLLLCSFQLKFFFAGLSPRDT